jgi:type II secretory pathway component PulJ
MNKLATCSLRRRGFSLVELLVSTAIAIIIGSAVVLLLVQQTQLTATQNRNMMNSEQVRSVLVMMADEIQMMGNGVSEPFILNAQADDFTFYSDIDNNGIRDRIRYWRSGNELRRTLATSPNGTTWTDVGTDVLIPNIFNTNTGPNPGLQFQYFGVNNGLNPATVADIRAVQITICLDTSLTDSAFTKSKVSPQNMVAYATIRNR